MWRLIFTTGFVGTALFLSFLAIQFFVHFRRREPLCLVGCITLVTSVLFFFVYDSLETPLLIFMLAVGLMNRERIAAQGQRWPPAPARRSRRTHPGPPHDRRPGVRAGACGRGRASRAGPDFGAACWSCRAAAARGCSSPQASLRPASC